MIKHFLYSMMTLAVLSTSISCEDSNRDNFRQDTDYGYVRFADKNNASFVLGTDITLIEIPLELYANTNMAGLDVYYTIQDIYGDNQAVILNDPGFVHFEPGQIKASTKIEIKPDATQSLYFRITLSSVSRDNIRLLDNIDQAYMNKEVCVGQMAFDRDYTGEVYQVYLDENGDIDEEEYTSGISTSLVPTSDPNVYTFSDGAWGSEFVPIATGNSSFAYLNYPGQITINSQGKVVVQGDGLPVQIGSNPNVIYNAHVNNGSVNPCTEEITYILQQSLFTGDFFVKVVIRPVN